MNKYEVILTATFRKTVYVKASSIEKAVEIAQEATFFDEAWEMEGTEFEEEYSRELVHRFSKDDEVEWLEEEE